ncbi:MAG: insulinase family protein [Candidatus Kapabacteria bacterium]|nr:insulinase family protein [Candidatus Kapabacteria bacterium]MDW8011571.1 pitrilysin family protein [Bacteroidota bacterium]
MLSRRLYPWLLLIALHALSYAAAQQKNWSKPPEPLPAKEFRFPEHKEFQLPNGLKVFLIEDHEQPTVTLRLQINAGDASDDIPGVAHLTALMLTKGAGKRSAQQIAAAIDSVGATLRASSAGDFTSVTASTLKKHLRLVLEIFADVVQRPTFPEEELQKLRPQVISEIRQERARPGSLAQAMARKVVYGEEHPYARRRTEQSVEQIRARDLRRFHEQYYHPRNATLAVVGDVREAEILPLLRQAFGQWKKRGEVKERSFPAVAPMPNGIYFIARPGSVQSSIVVTAATVPFAHPDYEALEVLAELLGSGFGGRLFRSLRETYAYTYAPFAFQTEAKYINRLALGADVRTPVTDSALRVIQHELEQIREYPPTEEELNRIKQAMVGTYLRSFESPEFIASLLQRADLYGLTKDHLRLYPNRILDISPWQVRNVAEKYLQPMGLRVVVVGDPKVLPQLQAIAKVYEYTQELQPAPVYQPVEMSVEELLRRYVAAVGGSTKLEALQSLRQQGRVRVQVSGMTIEGEFERSWKAPNKSAAQLKTPYFVQRSWSDGSNVWVEASGVRSEVSGREREKELLQAHPFYVAYLPKLGFRCEVLGKRGDQIVLRAEAPYGGEHLYYFNASSYLLERAEKMEPTAHGDQPLTEVYSEYMQVDGLRLPKHVQVDSPWGALHFENAYQLNPAVEDSEFIPPTSSQQ